MATSRCQRQLFLLFAILLLASHATTQTVSIESITGYLAQRTCVQQCIIGRHTDGNPAVLRDPIGCSSPYQNACMCNTARAAVWTTALSGCVETYCANKTADLSAALSLYNGYCATQLPLVTSAPTVSLASVPDYKNARSCVQGCMLSRPPNGETNLVWGLQCGGNPNSRTYDECFCRKDLATDANTFLTSCVNKWCEDNAAQDISSAVSLYGSYCGSARAAVTGGGGGSDNTEPGATPGSGSGDSPPSQTGGPNGGNSNDNNSSTGGNGSGPSVGMIVGIVIGALAVVAILALLIFLRIRRSKQPKPGPYNALDPKDHGQTESVHELTPSPRPSPQPIAVYNYMYQQQQPQPPPQPVPESLRPMPLSEFAVRHVEVTPSDSVSQLGVHPPSAYSGNRSSNNSRRSAQQRSAAGTARSYVSDGDDEIFSAPGV